MPTLEAISNTCRTRFKAEIADTYTIQTQYDNDIFTLDREDMGSYELWARCSVIWGERNLGEISGSTPTAKTHRQHGQYHVQLRAEVEAGVKNILIISELVKTAFNATTVDGVKFMTPTPVFLGLVEEEKSWFRVDVQCPFYAESVE